PRLARTAAPAGREAEALRRQLPLALRPVGRAGGAARAPAGLARRRGVGRARRRRLADRRLARAGGVRPDGHPLRRPPESRPDPPGRGLERIPAAQGLSDRRRAGALLGSRVVAVAPERPLIYEGSRIPSPI